ncbi:MAG: membrane protein insertase YidC [Planctomycetota bacterium]|jgi:YidC/Oxa1 family membrane protein insertase
MEKRLPLALILSLLFIWFYLGQNPPVAPEEQGQGAVEPGVSGPAVGVDPGNLPTRPGGAPAGAGPAAGAAGTGVAAEPQEPSQPVSFSGHGYLAQFETRGASLGWLELSDYHTEPNGEIDLRLVTPGENDRSSLLLREFNERYPLDSVNWESQVLTTPAGRRQILFTWTAPDGLQFRRTVTDNDGMYAFDLSIEVVNAGETDPGGILTLILEGPFGLVDDQPQSFITTGPTALAVVSSDGEPEVTKWSGGDLSDGGSRTIGDSETLLAAGSMTNYFAGLIVPRGGTAVKQVWPSAVLDVTRLTDAVAEMGPVDAAEEAALRYQLAPDFRDNAAVSMLLASRSPKPGETVRFDFGVYIGPKDRTLAEQPEYQFLRPMLEEAFGSMAWINHGLLLILRFFHNLVGNWGFAIILLTIVVKALLFPLNRVQQASMHKYSAVMQKLKPEIDALKAKYKNNKRKFNEEQMKLMRSHGASPPLGGCLLMFIQFPIWISLFQILKASIELRHSPFVGWVHDLSQADRMPLPFSLPFFGDTLNLLPILMAAATMAQMRFQPKPADESQAQMQKTMGMMMPLVMLVFLYKYPAGLSLYIFTSSLIGIFEFQVIRRCWPPKGMPKPGEPIVIPAAVTPPPAKRPPARPKGKGKRR